MQRYVFRILIVALLLAFLLTVSCTFRTVTAWRENIANSQSDGDDNVFSDDLEGSDDNVDRDNKSDDHDEESDREESSRDGDNYDEESSNDDEEDDKETDENVEDVESEDDEEENDEFSNHDNYGKEEWKNEKEENLNDYEVQGDKEESDKGDYNGDEEGDDSDHYEKDDDDDDDEDSNGDEDSCGEDCDEEFSDENCEEDDDLGRIDNEKVNEVDEGEDEESDEDEIFSQEKLEDYHDIKDAMKDDENRINDTVYPSVSFNNAQKQKTEKIKRYEKDERIEEEINDKVDDEEGTENGEFADIHTSPLIVEETSTLVAVTTISYVSASDPWNIELIIFRLSNFIGYHSRKILLFIGGIGERIGRKGILKNKKRREMYEYILLHPGSHFREILRATKANSNEGVWHLRILEKAGLIKSGHFGRYLIYYPNKDGDERKKMDWNMRFVLRRNKYFKIAKAIKDNRCIQVRKLAEVLSIPPNTVRYYVNKLEQFGLIKKMDCNGTIKIFPEAELERLIRYLESEKLREASMEKYAEKIFSIQQQA